jgi:nucleoside-diphosphate-sugar epimerase
MKNVLICGSDGYIGTALTLRLLQKGYKVIGIDDFRRRKAVKEMGSFSAIPIMEPQDKIKLLKSIGDFEFYPISLTSSNAFFQTIKSDVIVNLAQQPSAPYSHKSKTHTIKTISNNLIGTIHIIYAIKEINPEAHLVQIGSMGEYDQSIGISIPEGTFEFEGTDCIFPRRPGSFYHASKVASTYYIDLACRIWGLGATDIMQGIVFGNWTPEIEETGINTRLDSDEAFGTVVNRFIVQAMLNIPLTIYGEGEHSRGFLSLNDSIECLMLAIENPPQKGEYRTWNQLDKKHTMNQAAEEVEKAASEHGLKTSSQHISSPRVEKTTAFPYNPITNKLKNLGFKPTRTISQEAQYIFKKMENEDLNDLKNVVLPKIMWD